MLNITKNSIKGFIANDGFQSLKQVYQPASKRFLPRLLFVLLGLTILLMVLPWTQNIRATGTLIALKPEQRPQTIQTVIGGRIEKWFVQEGQRVKKGDTLLYISEIKDDYFDPSLLARTDEQLLHGKGKSHGQSSHRSNPRPRLKTRTSGQ